MGESKYEISQTAYVKLVLHALKHKTSVVNVILMGRLKQSPGSSEDNNNDNTEAMEIIHVIPLSHAQLSLLPTLEIAITQLIDRAGLLLKIGEEYFASKGDKLSVVGYYHANERYDDLDLNSLANKVGDHINRYCLEAAILLLDNKLLEGLPKGGNKKPVVQVKRKSQKNLRQKRLMGAYQGLTGNLNTMTIDKRPRKSINQA